MPDTVNFNDIIVRADVHDMLQDIGDGEPVTSQDIAIVDKYIATVATAFKAKKAQPEEVNFEDFLPRTIAADILMKELQYVFFFIIAVAVVVTVGSDG